MDNERGITNVTSIYTMVFFRIIFIISFLYLLKTGSYLPAFYLLILILIFEVAGLWSKLGLHKLHTQSILHPCRMFPGDKAELSIEIKNGKRLPTLLKWTQPLSKILKQVIKEGEAGAVSNGEIVTGKAYLGPFAEISRELYFTAQKRGYYKIPALQLQSRDVLGLFNRDSYVESKQHLAVYPRLLPLDSIEFKASDFSGLKRDSRPYLFDPIMFVGLRDYTPDMPARFISWKASAHKDRLLSKIVESSSSLRICIAIDVEAFMLPEPREEEFERALSIAASLAVWADNCRIPFGLVSNASMTGKHGNAIVPVNRSDDQGRQVLEALARVEFNTYGSLEAILKAEALHIPWGTTLIILGVERPILIPSTVRQVVYYGGAQNAE